MRHLYRLFHLMLLVKRGISVPFGGTAFQSNEILVRILQGIKTVHLTLRSARWVSQTHMILFFFSKKIAFVV